VQRDAASFTGVDGHVFLPIGKNAVCGSTHIIVVRRELGNRKPTAGIGVNGVRSGSSRRLITHSSMRNGLVIWADHNARKDTATSSVRAGVHGLWRNQRAEEQCAQNCKK